MGVVQALADDLATLDHYGTEWCASGFGKCFARQGNRPLHEGISFHHRNLDYSSAATASATARTPLLRRCTLLRISLAAAIIAGSSMVSALPPSTSNLPSTITSRTEPP